MPPNAKAVKFIQASSKQNTNSNFSSNSFADLKIVLTDKERQLCPGSKDTDGT